MHFMAVKKLRKRTGFVIYSNFKDSPFTAVKRAFICIYLVSILFGYKMNKGSSFWFFFETLIKHSPTKFTYECVISVNLSPEATPAMPRVHIKANSSGDPRDW